MPRAHLCAKRRMRVRISRSKIDKLACQAQSADIFSSAENPAITYSIPSRLLRRLASIVCYSAVRMRRMTQYTASGMRLRKLLCLTTFIFLGRVVVNSYQLFLTRLPAASTKKTVFDGLFSLSRGCVVFKIIQTVVLCFHDGLSLCLRL